jgi:hypothetical protein
VVGSAYTVSLYPSAPLFPLYSKSPGRENRWRPNLTCPLHLGPRVRRQVQRPQVRVHRALLHLPHPYPVVLLPLGVPSVEVLCPTPAPARVSECLVGTPTGHTNRGGEYTWRTHRGGAKVNPLIFTSTRGIAFRTYFSRAGVAPCPCPCAAKSLNSRQLCYNTNLFLRRRGG